MYGAEPERINVGQVLLAEQCPASVGSGTKVAPDLPLRRWKDVAGACLSWHQGTDVDEAAQRWFEWMDQVQRDLCTELLRSYARAMSESRHRLADPDPTPSIVEHPAAGAAASAAVLFGLDGGELVKLRTGRFGAGPEETAVLLEALDEGETVIEVMAATGEVEELDMAPEDRRAHLERLFGLWDAQRAEARSTGTRPGRHCYRCPRPARCGQFPTVDGVRVGAFTRTILLPKTWAKRLSVCQRQVAWKRLYGIPDDSGDDESSDAARSGVRFHDLLAATLLEDDPSEAFEVALQGVPDSEVATMRWLWDRHRQLEAEHDPVGYVGVEYEVGPTLQALGLHIDSRDTITPDKPVAVVFMARADATGREPDGTPAVVEHRTGPGATDIDQTEMDAYALGVALVTGKREVAVHLHLLGLAEGPRCVRQRYGEADLAEAVERLSYPARIVANWHPVDALDPPYRVGPWCQGCGYRLRCARYRGPNGEAESTAAPTLRVAHTP